MRCTCEESPRSQHGVVGDAELLYRVVLSPDHLTKKGELKPSLFPCSHITEKGLSVIRSEKLEEGELSSICTSLAAMKPERKWHGGFEFRSEIVRTLVDLKGRRLCLLDDPTPAQDGVPANDAHALIVASSSGMTEEDAKEIRAEFLTTGRLRLTR